MTIKMRQRRSLGQAGMRRELWLAAERRTLATIVKNKRTAGAVASDGPYNSINDI